MTYKVKINGKEYTLPARTLTVDEQIEEIGNLDARYRAGDVTRRYVVEKIHAFVENMAAGAFPVLEDVDTNDLLQASTDIIAAYGAPVQRMRVESQVSAAREMLKHPEIQKLLTVAPLLAQKK